MEQPLTLKMNIKYIKTRLACMNLGDFYSSECFLLISLGYKLEKTSCAMHQHEGIRITPVTSNRETPLFTSAVGPMFFIIYNNE